MSSTSFFALSNDVLPPSSPISASHFILRRILSPSPDLLLLPSLHSLTRIQSLIRFFRGLRNPIGIKVGPSSSPEELVRLLGIVDPNKEPGRVTLISRYGADKVSFEGRPLQRRG